MTVRNLTLAIVLASATMTSAQLRAEPFTFVSLPDTQIYAQNRFPDGGTPAVTDPRGTGAIFFDQTQWIVDNASGIDYFGHLGDVVQNGENLTQWALAKEAMDMLLNANIPHGTVMGNHDDIPPSFMAAMAGCENTAWISMRVPSALTPTRRRWTESARPSTISLRPFTWPMHSGTMSRKCWISTRMQCNWPRYRHFSRTPLPRTTSCWHTRISTNLQSRRTTCNT